MKAKKYFKTFLVALVILPGVLFSQSYQKGQIDLNAGLGIGTTFIGSGYRNSYPPIIVSGEYAVTDDIGVGVYLGFTGASYKYSGLDWCPSGNGQGNAYGNLISYTDTYKWNYSIFGLRGAYHFGKLIKNDKLDLYGGLMLGLIHASYSYSTDDPCVDHIYITPKNYGGFAWSLFAGCRYRFNKKIGVYGELGYGITVLNLGVNFKF